MSIAIPAFAALALLAAGGWAEELARAGDPASALERWRVAAGSQSAAASSMAPLLGLWLLTGVAAGLAWRDRAVESGRHASPGAAWIAKRVLAATGTAALGWAAGLWRADPGAFLAAGALHAASWAWWLRNLPPKL